MRTARKKKNTKRLTAGVGVKAKGVVIFAAGRGFALGPRAGFAAGGRLGLPAPRLTQL